MYYVLGAFGCIYKGIWTYMTVDNNEESKIVALKTIKSKLMFGMLLKTIFKFYMGVFCTIYEPINSQALVFVM